MEKKPVQLEVSIIQSQKEQTKLNIVFIIVWIMTFISLLYIWFLEYFAQIGFCNPGNYWYKKDPKTYTNVYSISQYISTPQATGMMSATFFFPILFMWQAPGCSFKGPEFYTLVLFQLSFGSFLTLTTTYNSVAHSIAVFLFAVFLMLHFIVKISEGYHSRISTVVLSVGIFGLACVILGSFETPFIPNEGLWFWFWECLALSCCNLYTPILVTVEEFNIRKYFEHTGKPNTYVNEEEQAAHAQWEIQLKYKRTNAFISYILMCSVIPSLFLIILPYTSEIGLASVPTEDQLIRISVYLNTPQANGAMAAVFYFTLLCQWDTPIHQNKRYDYYRCWEFWSLFIFQICFQLSLVFPNVYAPMTHEVFYQSMKMFLFIYFIHQKKDDFINEIASMLEYIVLICSAVNFVFFIMHYYKEVDIGKWYYYLETIQFIAMIWVIPCIMLDQNVMNKHLKNIRIAQAWFDMVVPEGELTETQRKKCERLKTPQAMKRLYMEKQAKKARIDRRKVSQDVIAELQQPLLKEEA